MALVANAMKGIRKTGTLLTLALAAIANTGTLWQLSNAAILLGNRSVRIKRLKGANYSGVDTWLYIGTGLGAVAFVQAMPRLRLVNNFNFDFGEGDLPEVNFTADITGYVDDATVDVQIEVEETG